MTDRELRSLDLQRRSVAHLRDLRNAHKRGMGYPKMAQVPETDALGRVSSATARSLTPSFAAMCVAFR